MEEEKMTEEEFIDLLNNHDEEIEDILDKAYTDLENELRNLGDNNE